MKGLVDQLSGLSFIFIRRAVGDLEGCKLGVVSQIQVRDVKGKAGDPALGCRKAFVEGLPHQSSPVTLQSEAQSVEFVFFSFPFFAFFFFWTKLEENVIYTLKCVLPRAELDVRPKLLYSDRLLYEMRTWCE